MNSSKKSTVKPQTKRKKMSDDAKRHLARPENTHIELEKLTTMKASAHDSNSKDAEESRTKLLPEPEPQRPGTKALHNLVNENSRDASEKPETNAAADLTNADDSSTIPASSSSNNWDLPATTDDLDLDLPPSSSLHHHHPPAPHDASSSNRGKKGKQFEGRRRTFRLSQKQKEAVKRHAKLASKSFFMFLVSHVGLTCVVVAYSIMGGFVFMALEKSNEEQSITHIHEIRKHHVSKLWNLTDELNIFDPLLFRERADELLTDFQMEIYEAVKDKGWDGTDNVTQRELQWNFAGSLLYSVTVITTIGYGHLTPKTMWGRVVTMAYALVGIPMTLLCLANIGSFMARCFRLLWKQIVCQPCRQRLKRRSMYMTARKKAATAVYLANMAKRKRVEAEAGIEGEVTNPGVVGSGSGLGSGLGFGARPLARGGGGVGTDDVRVSCSSDSPGPAVHDSTALLGRQNDEGGGSLGSANAIVVAGPASSVRSARDCDYVLGFEGVKIADSSGKQGGWRGGGGSVSSSDLQGVKNQDPLPSKTAAAAAVGGLELGDGGDDSRSSQSKPGESQPLTPPKSLGPDSRKDEPELHALPPPYHSLQDFGGEEIRGVPVVESTLTEITITTTTGAGVGAGADAVASAQPEDLQPVTDCLPESDLATKKVSKSEVVRVPIMVCLVMVTGYIIMGAVLFSLWERWSYFDSSYFCFITLSTIGFGDIVPGYEHNSWDNQAKRVSCTLYLLFGLALVAMCFDLIQTECREIFNDLARALGFTDDDNE